MHIKHTDRGFAIVPFVDSTGTPCSLQKSSLATDTAIWFGITKTVSGQKSARMHVTCMMTLDIARAMQVFVNGETPAAFTFIDLYGNKCAVRAKANCLLVGIIEMNEPGVRDHLMRLDRQTAKDLLPFLASFIRSGEITNTHDAVLPNEKQNDDLQTMVAGEDLAITGIADADVSVQSLLDDFVNLVGDLGENVLREYLGQDRAKALITRRMELAPLRRDE